MGLFGILAGASLYLALAGQASCGCFGQIVVHPWWTFALDGAVVAALLFGRPAVGAGMLVGPVQRGFVKVLAGALVLLGLIAGVLVLRFENPTEALARLRGEAIRVQPSVSDVGDGPVGEERTFHVQLTNNTNQPVRIVGGTSTCSCIATESLPVTLLKGETKTIDVRVKFRGSPGRFQHRFTLLTDNDIQGFVIAQFTGRVVGAPR